MGKRSVKSKNFQESSVSYVVKIKISTNLFPIKDAIPVWFTTAIKRLFKVVQAQTKLQIEKVQGLQLQEIWLPTWEVLPDLS